MGTRRMDERVEANAHRLSLFRQVRALSRDVEGVEVTVSCGLLGRVHLVAGLQEQAIEEAAGGMGRSVGQAEIDQRALIAFRLAPGDGSDSGGDQTVETGRGVLRLAA